MVSHGWSVTYVLSLMTLVVLGSGQMYGRTDLLLSGLLLAVGLFFYLLVLAVRVQEIRRTATSEGRLSFANSAFLTATYALILKLIIVVTVTVFLTGLNLRFPSAIALAAVLVGAVMARQKLKRIALIRGLLTREDIGTWLRKRK